MRDRWVVCGPGEWAGGGMYELGVFACVCSCVCYVQEAACAHSSWTPAVCASARHLIYAGHAHSVSSFYLHTHTHTHTQMLAYTLSFPPWCHRFGAPWQQWARKQERMREGKRTDIISCWGDEVVINSSWCSFVSDDGDGRVWWGGGRRGLVTREHCVFVKWQFQATQSDAIRPWPAGETFFSCQK